MHHHERYDGLGYPMGLDGQQIPEFARILAIADEFERMTGERAGGLAISEEEALAELGALAGTHLDPEFGQSSIAAWPSASAQSRAGRRQLSNAGASGGSVGWSMPTRQWSLAARLSSRSG